VADAFLGSRSNYSHGQLNETDLDPVPFRQLQQWLDEAHAQGLLEPTAMTLATVSDAGRPSCRVVLLRGLNARGLVFFTNYLSRKGREIESNPAACVCFWWGDLERQVRVEGRIERVSPTESDAYFAARPRASQIASAASPQSQPVPNREALEACVSQLEAASGETVARPDHWGGYRLVPDRWEFWQGRESRLHDRFCVTRTEHGWVTQRLAP